MTEESFLGGLMAKSRVVTSTSHLEAIVRNLEFQLVHARVSEATAEGFLLRWFYGVEIAEIIAQIRFVEDRLAAAKKVAYKMSA